MKKSFVNYILDTYKKYKGEQKPKEVPEYLKSILIHIDYKLRYNDVNFEIPFVYKNKIDFDHIKVIVPNYFTPQQLCEMIGSYEYKINKEFVEIFYKDFKIVFILVPENDIPITFWYYSWDILPTLMNVLFEQFGLYLDKNGLKYKEHGNYLLSNKIDEIVEFLGLNFKQFKNGFFTLENEINFLMNSPCFNADEFFNYKLDPKDYFYEEKKLMFEECLKFFEPFKGSMGNFNFSENKDEYLAFIVEYFHDSGIMDKIFKKRKFSNDSVINGDVNQVLKKGKFFKNQ